MVRSSSSSPNQVVRELFIVLSYIESPSFVTEVQENGRKMVIVRTIVNEYATAVMYRTA